MVVNKKRHQSKVMFFMIGLALIGSQ